MFFFFFLFCTCKGKPTGGPLFWRTPGAFGGLKAKKGTPSRKDTLMPRRLLQFSFSVYKKLTPSKGKPQTTGPTGDVRATQKRGHVGNTGNSSLPSCWSRGELFAPESEKKRIYVPGQGGPTPLASKATKSIQTTN